MQTGSATTAFIHCILYDTCVDIQILQLHIVDIVNITVILVLSMYLLLWLLCTDEKKLAHSIIASQHAVDGVRKRLLKGN